LLVKWIIGFEKLLIEPIISRRRALIISNTTALNGYQSGASLRVSTIKALLDDLGFEVVVTTTAKFKSGKSSRFDLIALTPFSAAKVAHRARRMTDLLWFDACDSWVTTRVSRIKHGELKQFLALIQDFVLNTFHPKYDVLSFISLADTFPWTSSGKKHPKNRYIFPNQYQNLHLNDSNISRVVFVGDGSYEPNRQAIGFLSKVAKFLPSGLRIHIIGRGYTYSNSPLIFEGYRNEKELYYSRDIHVAPIFAGAGIKNKVAIPFILGLQVITTRQGTNGLEFAKNLRIAEKPKDFAEGIMAALAIQAHNAPPIRIFSIDETTELRENLKRILNA
jgi:hypothetical protein